jgi:hypothetical protein
MSNCIRRRFGFVLGLTGLVPVVLLVLYLGAARPGMANPLARVSSEKIEAVESLYFTQLLTETTAFTVHLPLVMNGCRFSFFDDFSDPSSGWPTGNTVFGSAYYDQGVYRMIANNVGGYKIIAAVSPDWIVPNDSVIKVNAWIESVPPDAPGLSPSVGLVFGVSTVSIYDQLIWKEWYEFRVFVFEQRYEIWKWYLAGSDYDFTVLTSGNSLAILPELNTVQKLEVRRSDNAMTLVINGTVLETFTDDSTLYMGDRTVGISAGHFDRAGFDNFEVTSTTCMPGQ